MVIAKNITVLVDDNEYIFQEHEDRSINITSKKDGQTIKIPDNCLTEVSDMLHNISKFHTYYDW